MPLSFEGVYKLTNLRGNLLPSPLIAMAPRERKEVVGELGERPVIQYLVPNEVNGGHTLAGTLVIDKGEQIIYRDDVLEGDDGEPVYWMFEPLTLENWEAMSSGVTGAKQIRSQVKTDVALREFYHSDWVDGWWEQGA